MKEEKRQQFEDLLRFTYEKEYLKYIDEGQKRGFPKEYAQQEYKKDFKQGFFSLVSLNIC